MFLGAPYSYLNCLFTLKTPAVHTTRVKQAGKYGARISMNIAMSLRTSANSLKKKILIFNSLPKTNCTRLLAYVNHAYLHFLASESSLLLLQRE